MSGMKCTDPFIVDIQWYLVLDYAQKGYQIKCHFTPFSRKVRDLWYFFHFQEDSIYWKMNAAENWIWPKNASLITSSAFGKLDLCFMSNWSFTFITRWSYLSGSLYTQWHSSSNSHFIKWDQTIFPSSLSLVTLIWMEEKQDGCTTIKVYCTKLLSSQCCWAKAGYQPKYNVMNIVCDWFPALFRLIANKFKWNCLLYIAALWNWPRKIHLNWTMMY